MAKKIMKNYHSNTKQSTRTIIIHYKKGMNAISVKSSASVLVTVVSSIKQKIHFINSLRQLNVFVRIYNRPFVLNLKLF